MSGNDAPLTAETGPPDVDALMARVRAGVEEKVAAGIYTREELARIEKLALEIQQGTAFGPETKGQIARLRDNWDPLLPYPFTSHRAGVGRLIAGAKRAVQPALRPLASVMLSRQADFNAAVAGLLAPAFLGVQRMQETYDAVQKTNDTLLEGFQALLDHHEELARRHRDLAEDCADLRRELRHLQARVESAERASLPPEALTRPAPEPAAEPPPAISYLEFEEKHRGPSAGVKQKLRGYLRHFAGLPGRVLDAGCGRGEFLELLAETGVPAYGVDLDPEMTARSREKGLEVETADLVAHLRGLPDGSLGGIFAAQVVEHMDTDGLLEFVRLAHAKLAPGGRFLAETVNPACLATFSGAFYLDLSHTRPVHPEALRFLLEGFGFRDVLVEFTSPFPPEHRLQEFTETLWMRESDRPFVRLVNENFGRLNAVIYGHQDYAAIGTR